MEGVQNRGMILGADRVPEADTGSPKQRDDTAWEQLGCQQLVQGVQNRGMILRQIYGAGSGYRESKIEV